jgi:hypothetical protein
MDSKITETPIMTDSPRSIAIPFNMEGLNESNMCDLNKVFQINFSYNVELLKNLLEGILKFQKTTEEEIEAIKEDNKDKNMKIRKLESKLMGMGRDNISNQIKIKINEDKKDKDKVDEKKPKKVEPILISENNENKNMIKKTIYNPQDDNIILQTSDSNMDIINKIIVSKKII